MNTLILPPPIAAYFAAEHNPEALARCFTAQAVMKDDGHTYTGVAAITAFLAKASAQYGATSVPLDIQQEGDPNAFAPTSPATSRGVRLCCPTALASNEA
ncbi:nuclear transport factor 2 family protein [Herbaspirillum huttiense]|uniref:nuclear transport factor 2 family protein n=1 Tax=Herbaspirillum huttiense TaxID=863372 RepID=UPI0031CDEC80